MNFLCESFLSVSQSGNGALYPVYRRVGGNIPYVQEVDRHGRISAFIEVTDIENYSIHHVDQSWSRELFDESIFGFILHNKIEVFEFQEVRRKLKCNDIDFTSSDIPLLTRVAILRVAGGSDADLSDSLLNYVNSVKGASIKRDAIIRAERRSLKSQSEWWDSIYKSEFGQSEEVKNSQYKSKDEIISWLYENDVSDDWKKIFAVVLGKVLFDERISDLLTKFIIAEEDFSEFDHLSKSILGRGLESYMFLPSSGGDFEDLIVDRILDGSIFYIASSVSHRVFSGFLKSIIKNRESDGYDDIIVESLIDVIENEVVHPRVVNIVMEVLFECDLNIKYDDRSSYSGIRRIDRIINIFNHNPAISLYLRDRELREFLINASYSSPES